MPQELSHRNILENITNGTSFIVFYASWCQYCKKYLASGTLEKLEKKFPNIKFFKFESTIIPEQKSIAETLFRSPNGGFVPVTSFPTFAILKYENGQLYYKIFENGDRSFEAQSEMISKFLSLYSP